MNIPETVVGLSGILREWISPTVKSRATVVVISGPSGSGKTSTALAIQRKCHRLPQVHSFTTRLPRTEDLLGRGSVVCVADHDFDKMAGRDGFLTYRKGSARVGINVTEIEGVCEQYGGASIVVSDFGAIAQLKAVLEAKGIRVVSICVNTPQDICRYRLLCAGYSIEQVTQRLSRGAYFCGQEQERLKDCDFIITNEGAAEELTNKVRCLLSNLGLGSTASP